jgi:hypothetical protein
MTLAIGWLHDGGDTVGTWLHDAGDWQKRERASRGPVTDQVNGPANVPGFKSVDRQNAAMFGR